MKKLLFIAGILLTQHSFAQTIPNSGFETWATAGPFEAPTGWAVSPGVRKSNQSHSGSWAIQCTVDTFTSPVTSTLDTVVGNAYSGAMTMGPPTPGVPLNGYAFTSRPDSLTGFYKYHSVGPDSLSIVATLSHWNNTTNSREVVGLAVYTTNINDTVYKRFSVQLQYLTSATPDTCVIQMVAANPQAPKHMGTSAWVDDLAFANHNTLSVSNLTTNNLYTLYPNPCIDVLHIYEKASEKIKNVQVKNINGEIIANTTCTDINTNSWANGIYFLQITDTDNIISVQQVIKQ